MTTAVLLLTLILRVSTLPEFQAGKHPQKTLDNPPNGNKTKYQRQPIGMITVFHVETYKAFPYCCLFFVQLEQKHTSSDFDGLTDWNASNKKHVVHTELTPLLNKFTPSTDLEGNDVRRIYTRHAAHNQYRSPGLYRVSSGPSARDPPASQPVRLPSFFMQ